MELDKVTVLIRLQLLPELIAQGLNDLLALAREVRKSGPDCPAIECARDIGDPTKLTMIEKWSSREACEGPHMNSPHMTGFIEGSARYFVGSPAISFCNASMIDA